MDKLLQGIRAFQQKVFPRLRARFEKLSRGQWPSTLMITCADSRIVPHLITQTEPGELFVLRNAGNLVPPYGDTAGGEAATIEFAVRALNVEQIVVCGHSHCAAIHGLLNPDTIATLPSVRQWLAHAEPTRQAILRREETENLGRERLPLAIQANVLVQLAHLRTYPAVAEAESQGWLSLHGWYYELETGEVFVFCETTHEFVTVSQLARDDSSD